MLAAILLAASLPLGVWPAETGAATTVVDDIEYYVVEPEDDYSILAMQPLAPPLVKAEPAALKHLTALARRLGADGVLLLAELPEDKIPADPNEALPQGKRLVAAVFVSFEASPDEEQGPRLTHARARRPGRSPLQHARHAVVLRGRRGPDCPVVPAD